jgi:phosphopantothenoylcysteine decarboxylase/phosphopantothenate--cysteine ligase
MSTPPRVLILAGPTREYIDPVRFISNASTGRQGLALAQEALSRGYGVEMVLGPVDVDVPNGVRVFNVVRAAEMLEQAVARHPFCDILVAVAAVGDFRPRDYSTSKHKSGREWRLELEPTEDILARLATTKGWRVHVGFALETDTPLENGMRKLLEKKLDWIVVNSPDAIGADTAEYEILGAAGSKFLVGQASKELLATRLFDRIDGSLAEMRAGNEGAQE